MLDGGQEYQLRERTLAVLRTWVRGQEGERLSEVQQKQQFQEAPEPKLPREKLVRSTVGVTVRAAHSTARPLKQRLGLGQ